MRFTLFLIGLATLLNISIENEEKNINQSKNNSFDIENDLLLIQYDCKTDVDDLHSVAAFATLASNPEFSKIKYHAVAGTYGVQEGLYVPPNELFQLAFGENWTDAHENFPMAINTVKEMAKKILKKKGDIWIAEAGQSDFSAALVKAIQGEIPNIDTTTRIHLVQHSEWNEEVTAHEKLQFVKQHTHYQKIPDGNALNNGTPGFRSPDFKDWNKKIKGSKLVQIWQLAIDLANEYNGKENRYLNDAIAQGGVDFSDFSEVCWILGLQDIKDSKEFFNTYSE